MEYSGLAFDTGHGKDETIKSERTIIFIGGFGRKNKNGCMAYGVYNGGFDAAGSTRWYMYVSSSSQFRYGVLGSGSQDIPNYTYTYENENPKIFFCADRCVVNTDGSAVRELMVDGFYAKALNVAPKTGSEKFLSNFFLGNNAYEPRGFSSTDARLYLFLIYERTLTNAEISQIQAYARSKGYIE